MITKYCTGCKKTHTADFYDKNKNRPDGISHYCKSCTGIYGKKHRIKVKATREKLIYRSPEGYKICFTCKKEFSVTLFNVKNRTKDKLTPSCKSCINKRKVYKPMTSYSIKVIPELLLIEKWKQVTLNGELFNYLISDCGRVKSLFKNKILKYSFDEDGYPQVILYGNGKRLTRKVHILNGLHHVKNENPALYTQLNHEDGDKSNPYAYNLKWCTHQQNIKHRDETGLAVKFTIYNHPSRRPVIKKSTGEIFPAVKLAAIDAGIPHLYQFLCGQRPNTTDYCYYEK